HEYYQGEIFAMAGTSEEHNKIVGNTFGELYIQLKGKPCRPYVADLRTAVKQNAFYTYPDISVICGKLEKTDDKFDTATNPTVIIEVLSESTKDYDRGTKFKLYRGLVHLRDYILIDSTGKVGIEHYTLNTNAQWVLQEY
ncbi:MAG TPA: Uma2 family endonuclease, partial [Saprospiraceae bacterium]|nr:Uma2 family endonuclease [Saprospiraceae bacterium]